jgi:hypothetical protein
LFGQMAQLLSQLDENLLPTTCIEGACHHPGLCLTKSVGRSTN